MKKLLLLMICLASSCLFLDGCQSRKSESTVFESNCAELGQTPDHSLQKVLIDGQLMTLEVVNSPVSIQQGLSGRQTIGSDGMLFVMPSQDRHAFWMKGMLFDLDLLWIRDCQIVDYTSNVQRPVPDTLDPQLPTFMPNQPVDMVLEVPAETAQRLFSDPIGQYLSL